jgi:hypothetical protein
MDSNVTERHNIAPFHLRVRFPKGLRKTGCRFTNDRQLLQGGAALWSSLAKNVEASRPAKKV